ncbi:hypothetical protein [Halalkalibacter oceani]|uniref:hypothetical protein n=1 Tax=Halalkalibacter oceani TaxID=1653776 RepID=UPI00339AE97B
MNLMDRRVKVTTGYYQDIEGVVKGMTVDGYYLIMPASLNGFWTKATELEIIR